MELTSAPIVPLADAAGYMTVITDGPTPALRRVPISAVKDAAIAAASAVQPTDIGDAASLTVAEVQAIVDARLGDIDAILDAILS